MGDSSAVTSAFLVSLSSIAQVLTIIAAGALAAHNGMFSTSTRSAFAKFNLKIFFPALVLSIADDYNFKDLLRYLPLMGASCLHIIIGALLGYVTAKAFNISAPDRHFVLLMTAFNNNGGLPFILMVPLCSSWKGALEEGDPVTTLARSYVMIVIYGLPWTLILFSLGKMVIVDAGVQLKKIEGDHDDESRSPMLTGKQGASQIMIKDIDLTSDVNGMSSQHHGNNGSERNSNKVQVMSLDSKDSSSGQISPSYHSPHRLVVPASVRQRAPRNKSRYIAEASGVDDVVGGELMNHDEDRYTTEISVGSYNEDITVDVVSRGVSSSRKENEMFPHHHLQESSDTMHCSGKSFSDEKHNDDDDDNLNDIFKLTPKTTVTDFDIEQIDSFDLDRELKHGKDIDTRYLNSSDGGDSQNRNGEGEGVSQNRDGGGVFSGHLEDNIGLCIDVSPLSTRHREADKFENSMSHQNTSALYTATRASLNKNKRNTNYLLVAYDKVWECLLAVWLLLCFCYLWFKKASCKDYRQLASYLASNIKRIALLEPNITVAFISMSVACSGPFKWFFFHGPLSFVGGSLKSLGGPGPVVSTMVLSAGLYASYFPANYASKHGKKTRKPASAVTEQLEPRSSSSSARSVEGKEQEKKGRKKCGDKASTSVVNIELQEWERHENNTSTNYRSNEFKSSTVSSGMKDANSLSQKAIVDQTLACALSPFHIAMMPKSSTMGVENNALFEDEHNFDSTDDLEVGRESKNASKLLTQSESISSGGGKIDSEEEEEEEEKQGYKLDYALEEVKEGDNVSLVFDSSSAAVLSLSQQQISETPTTVFDSQTTKKEWGYLSNMKKWGGGRGHLVIIVCLLKLVVLPAICYPITAWFIKTGAVNKQDKLFQMILFIESAVPSSQSVVSIVQMEAGSRCTDRIAALYLPMYLASALTLSIAVALAIWIID